MRVLFQQVNMTAYTPDLNAWIKEAEQLISANKPDIYLMSEYACMRLLNSRGAPLTSPEIVPWLSQQVDDCVAAFQQLANAYKCIIIPGTWPVMIDNLTRKIPILVNRAYINIPLLEPLWQDKMHPALTEREGVWKITKGSNLQFFSWLGFKCAMLICHDVLSHSEEEEMLAYKPDVVFVPSMCDNYDIDEDSIMHISYFAKKASAQMDNYVVFTSSIGSQFLDNATTHNYGTSAVFLRGKSLYRAPILIHTNKAQGLTMLYTLNELY